MSQTTSGERQAARRRSTVIWVMCLCFVGLLFDGYDLVVFGSVLPTFLRPDGLIFNALSSQQQQVLTAWAQSAPPSGTPLPADVAEAQAAAKALGGLLGSYMMIGVLVGALTAGTLGDKFGRRKLMLGSMMWFSVGMLATALTSTPATFGWGRFFTGIGVGALVATTGAVVSEFAPAGKKNQLNALVYAGVPVGSMTAALLAIVALPTIHWQGMFLIGALPLVTLVPLAMWKLPESIAWLVSRGRTDEAMRLSEKTGVEVPQAPGQTRAIGEHAKGKTGWAGLFSAEFAIAAIVLGLTSATALLLVYSLNTWLPALMTPLLGERASLALLLVLNGGAAIGGIGAAYLADRFGAKPTVAVCFLIGAISIFLVTTTQLIGLLLLVIAVVGLGTTGTQTLIYGLASNYYPTRVRNAGVAWVAGFGRLGGIGGPVLGGWLAIWFADDLNAIFYILAAMCVLGMVFCLILPRSKVDTTELFKIEPSQPSSAVPVGPDTRR